VKKILFGLLFLTCQQMIALGHGYSNNPVDDEATAVLAQQLLDHEQKHMPEQHAAREQMGLELCVRIKEMDQSEKKIYLNGLTREESTALYQVMQLEQDERIQRMHAMQAGTYQSQYGQQSANSSSGSQKKSSASPYRRRGFFARHPFVTAIGSVVTLYALYQWYERRQLAKYSQAQKAA
jgi:hypothetical protein